MLTGAFLSLAWLGGFVVALAAAFAAAVFVVSFAETAIFEPLLTRLQRVLYALAALALSGVGLLAAAASGAAFTSI